MATYSDLLKEYRKLAKRADQRLVRLEKLSQQKGFEGVLRYGYARAQRDIKVWGGANATRFNIKPPQAGLIEGESAAEHQKAQERILKSKIADIKKFLDPNQTKTSTKSQILKVYKHRANEINKKFGSGFTWQDLADFHERGVWEKLQARYGYRTAFRVMERLRVDKDPSADIENSKSSISRGEEKSVIEEALQWIRENQNL